MTVHGGHPDSNRKPATAGIGRDTDDRGPVAGRLLIPRRLADQLGLLSRRVDRLERLVAQLVRDGNHTVGIGNTPENAVRVAGPAWIDHLAELRTGWTFCGRRFDTAVRRPDGTRPLCKNCVRFAGDS